MKTIYLVLPCYNEEAVLHETSARLKIKMNQLISENKISKDSRVTFVDDGSKDNTWSIIEELKESDELFAGVKLSRNRGHQNALLAGLMTVKDYCDAAISLDADLQDDVNVIDKFIDRFIDGCDVVYGVRSDRKTDTVFRFGGEEFVVILTETDIKQSEIPLERFRKTIETLDLTYQNQQINITVSIGACQLDQSIGNKEEFLQKADNALYDAKNSGRNKVVFL